MFSRTRAYAPCVISLDVLDELVLRLPQNDAEMPVIHRSRVHQDDSVNNGKNTRGSDTLQVSESSMHVENEVLTELDALNARRMVVIAAMNWSCTSMITPALCHPRRLRAQRAAAQPRAERGESCALSCGACGCLQRHYGEN